ncbi:hypothetical protein MKQ68_02240 [Chitinophaga horti]|uniref:DUF3857 domain-containing protein n=1 Tax=Chitinophaga horti TaxID=2920382 RepID=A0ABY6J6I9_9BACT|nr:hypothetical protein [Chitinophaga horti]UYQ93914.1 hypothetical protein MKQ68_02240 [Chitinophaga horti]
MRKSLFSLLLLHCCLPIFAQDTARYKGMTVNLDEVIVKAKRFGFDVNGFIKRVEEDTTFYMAFKHLRQVSFTADNDIKIFSKKKEVKASLKSQTRQIVEGKCRHMEVIEEKTTGDFYTAKKNYNYYTAELYANLFFTTGKICDDGQDTEKGRGSMEKHKSQLKQLIFNPGKPISGVPIVGQKVAIFTPDVMKLYNFAITSQSYIGKDCYVFAAQAREDLNKLDRSEIVINELVTYFDKDTWEIVGRKYSLSYKTMLFDFNVKMNVQMTKVGDLLVPALITYSGTWDVAVKKRETADFTARFFDFRQ